MASQSMPATASYNRLPYPQGLGAINLREVHCAKLFADNDLGRLFHHFDLGVVLDYNPSASFDYFLFAGQRIQFRFIFRR